MVCKKILLAFALLAGLWSCDKPYEWDKPLAVDSRLVKLTAKEGKTRVIVYSDRNWTCSVHSEEDGDWGRIDKSGGSGLGDMLFTYEANPGVTRTLAIALAAGAVKDTVRMQQAGAITAPRFVPATRNFTVASAGGSQSTTVNTNLTPCLHRLTSSVKWTEGAGGWISGIAVADGKITFTVSQNSSGSSRKAEIRFDIPGMVEPSPFPGAVITVTQNP